ncbi:GNAT family N-acetyltransferase [Rhodovarius sp.]|uniref:GNAT family N-acetyltransferase n=1 Tax=Rhodovarius sp. TaxID=2972673 RepID=UPI003341DC63
MTAPELATMAEVGALAAIHAAGFPPGMAWRAGDISGLMEMGGCFVLWWPGDAFIMCRLGGDEAEVLTLATAPPARRQGLAGRLLDAAIEACRGLGAGALFLEVGAGNAAAQALYCAAGFTEVARRPRYYADGTDAIVMTLRLS